MYLFIKYLLNQLNYITFVSLYIWSLKSFISIKIIIKVLNFNNLLVTNYQKNIIVHIYLHIIFIFILKSNNKLFFLKKIIK